MKYRTLGRTGLQVSEIGLGCEGFAEGDGAFARALLDEAEKQGINYVDLYSSDPGLRSRMGAALSGRRDRFLLQAHLCTVWKDGQYKRTRDLAEVRAGFTDLLARLGTDHIEVGMIHYVDAAEDWNAVAAGPVLAYARELREKGVIGAIGVSSHNPAAALAAVESGFVDVLMFSVNPCYDLLPGTEDCEDLWADESYGGTLVNMDPAREKLYETCQRLGVGISVMKVYGGGDLLDAALSPAGVALRPEQCLHYALTRPAVATVMCGAHSAEELARSAAYETMDEAQRDYAATLASMPRIRWQGHCMYCGHCAPCPQGIDVAAVTKFLNLTKAQKGVPETVREHYALLEHRAGACVACGACEKRCPFGVPVRQNMREAQAVFGD